MNYNTNNIWYDNGCYDVHTLILNLFVSLFYYHACHLDMSIQVSDQEDIFKVSYKMVRMLIFLFLVNIPQYKKKELNER